MLFLLNILFYSALSNAQDCTEVYATTCDSNSKEQIVKTLNIVNVINGKNETTKRNDNQNVCQLRATVEPNLSETQNCMNYDSCLADVAGIFKETDAMDAFVNDEALPIECVTRGHNASPTQNKNCFTDCTDLTKRPSDSSKPSCGTELYHTVLKNSIEAVAKCFGFKPGFIFPILVTESSLNINAMRCHTKGRQFAGSYDAGLGQLTNPMIRDVNQNFDGYKNILMNHTSAVCSALNEHVKKIPAAPSCRCAAISPPDNPITNLFYSMIGLNNKSRYVRTESKNTIKANKLKRETLHALIKAFGLDEQKIYDSLTVVSYNKGSEIVVEAFRSYLEHKLVTFNKMRQPDITNENSIRLQETKPVVDAAFIKSIKEELKNNSGDFAKFFGKDFSEDGGYSYKVRSSLQHIERKSSQKGAVKCSSNAYLQFQ